MLNAAGESVTVEPISFDDLGDDEILVRLDASGVCHTDLHVKRTGGWGMAFPILLGHEGAGYIEEVGSNVTDVAGGGPPVIARPGARNPCPAGRRGPPPPGGAPPRARQRGPPTRHGGRR